MVKYVSAAYEILFLYYTLHQTLIYFLSIRTDTPLIIAHCDPSDHDAYGRTHSRTARGGLSCVAAEADDHFNCQ